MKKRKTQSGQDLNKRFDLFEDRVLKALGVMDAKINGMATKADLNGMATKADLKKSVSKIDAKISLMDSRMDRMVTKDYFDQKIAMLVTKVEFDGFKEYVHENMYTKADQNHLLTLLDPIFSEFKQTRTNNVLIGKQLCDLDDTVAGHEKRILVLEEKAVS